MVEQRIIYDSMSWNSFYLSIVNCEVISESSCCTYFGIIVRTDLCWVDQVNYASHSRIWGDMLDRYRKFHISALDRVQNKAGKFAYHSGGTDWKCSVQRRKLSSMCALYKSYVGERAWKAIGDRLLAQNDLTMIDDYWKIRPRKQRTNIGKCSFVNRSITD